MNLKKMLAIGSLSLLVSSAFAQITKNDAKIIDEKLAETYLSNYTIHTENVNATFSGPVTTFDHVNGRYGKNNEDNQTYAWSNTEDVHPDIAEKINQVNGQNYALFDLNSFSEVNQYKEAVEHWLKSQGLPVSVNNIKDEKFKIFPNPARDEINIQLPNKEYNISIYDSSGKRIKEFSGKGLINYKVDDLSSGLYIIQFKNDQTSFSTKIIKR
jgi:hypothetical protein